MYIYNITHELCLINFNSSITLEKDKRYSFYTSQTDVCLNKVLQWKFHYFIYLSIFLYLWWNRLSPLVCVFRCLDRYSLPMYVREIREGRCVEDD